MTYMMSSDRERLEAERADLILEAARLAGYDLTIEGGRARTKYDAVVKREREIWALLIEHGKQPR